MLERKIALSIRSNIYRKRKIAINKTTYVSIITLGRGLFLQAFFVLTLPIFFGVNGVFFDQLVSNISALFFVIGLILLPPVLRTTSLKERGLGQRSKN